MHGSERATPELLELWTLFRETHKVFHSYWSRGGNLRAEEVQFLATITLSHIDDIDVGYRWTLRADEVPRDELGDVLRPADVTDWSSEPRRDPTPVSPDLRKVMALRHAQVVFGSLPRTPRGEISYPGYASYADIKVPRTPLELRERIEELAIGVWDAATHRSLGSLDPERARRVYGFFETGSWLANAHQWRIRRH